MQEKILNIIEKNSKIDTKELSVLVGEDEEAVKKNISDLEQKHVICGYHTVINWDKTNDERCSAVIEVSAKPERDVGYDAIAERIARFDEVTSLYLMSGKSEFLVTIEGKTMREIGDFVGQKLAPIEGVTSTVTCFMLKKYKVEGMRMEEEQLKDERQIVHE